MGFILKIILFFIVISFLFRAFFAWVSHIAGKKSTPPGTRQQSRPSPSEPETQEERIISYQKKSFETTEAEDVDFVEIKDRDKEQ
ncbi:hypothetical protein [Limibacterium fermenti]|uniref:hypothetical protein n=1 Tax=Limibacterium fermenti TaxID=3229863 RepID=UPI000E9D9986|nr:hypothetical protein [Porphyromonadaceae bacterium]